MNGIASLGAVRRARRLPASHRLRTLAAAVHALFPSITSRRAGSGAGAVSDTGGVSAPSEPVVPLPLRSGSALSWRAGRVPVGVGVGAEVGHDRRVVAAQVHGASGAGGVRLGGEVLPVVGQVGEQQPDPGVLVGDLEAVGGQLGDQLLAGGFIGAFLAEPLGDVLSGAAVADVGHDLVDGRVVVLELGEQRGLLQGDGLPERGRGLPGEPAHAAGLQRAGDFVGAEPGRFADAPLRRSVRAGAEQRVRLLQGGQALAVVVGGVHVEELPGLVALPLGGQVVGDLGVAELLGGGEPPVPLDHPVDPAPGGGDPQRGEDAELGDGVEELLVEVDVTADVARVRGQQLDGDHRPLAGRLRRRAVVVGCLRLHRRFFVEHAVGGDVGRCGHCVAPFRSWR